MGCQNERNYLTYMKKQSHDFNIKAFSKFSPKRLAEVRRFVALCKKLDGSEALFYWESIKNRKNLGINEILCYIGDELVGYLALYHFEAHEIEITVITHPDYRTPTLYALLWEQAKRAVAQYSVDITRFVFTCNQQLLSLKDYLNRLGADCSEYTYKLALSVKNCPKIETLGEGFPVELRKATPLDIPALTDLEMNCFQVSKEIYKNHLLKTFEDPSKEIMVAIKEEKIVGKIHVQIEKSNVLVYDFCVDPIEQRKGYGSFLLLGAARQLFNRQIKKMFIDVVDEYDLKWYTKFNFKCISTYEHWKLTPCADPLKEREKQLETLLLNFHCHQVQDQLSLTFYKH